MRPWLRHAPHHGETLGDLSGAWCGYTPATFRCDAVPMTALRLVLAIEARRCIKKNVGRIAPNRTAGSLHVLIATESLENKPT